MIDNDKENLFTRRAFILGGAQALLLSTIVGRMYYLEILSNQHYKTLSDKNRIHSRLIAPLRGQILDRKGQVIATNHNVYRAVIVRDQADDWRETLAVVQPLLKLSDENLGAIAKDIKSKPKFIPVTLKENISWAEVTKLELHLPDLPGVMIEEGRNRFYPYPFETSHFIGYVATPSEADLDGDPLLELPGFKVGKSGLEKSLEQDLRGVPGIKQVEVNAVRKVVRELATAEGTSGHSVELSLDLGLQQTVYNRMQEHNSGSAIVLDVRSGEILSYVSVPGFDNNLFVHGIPKKEWKELLDHPYKALINKPIAGQYSPGSTFKMVVALAALESGVVDQHTAVHCCGHVNLGSHKFHCWRKGGHGSVNLQMAIAGSCDTFFYHVAGLMGIDRIAAMAKRFGFGDITGVEISGEKKGLVPSRSWKQMVLGRGWSLGETYNASIGQGYVLATPMQLAVMTARLASGKCVMPTFLKREEANFPSLDIDPKFLKLVTEGMDQVVNVPGNTAYASRIPYVGMEMAGKTATTQVRRITEKERALGQTNSGSWVWHHRDHAFFVAFAPVHDPKFATVVLVEHGVSGGKVAGPIARDILIATQQLIKDI
ncbi:penicillin-binding protein 2 [Candidatus Paracaedibacter symbiosus]|uniref:penicillin-binding protein 2 n=1 Tax=Candidatus Paracaedibacter symbiosus TaxID=244582 RepID=UPI000691B70B|nr:penicillin-binding protein 2 [Candidatus Paracaedibacter symbiosus]